MAWDANQGMAWRAHQRTGWDLKLGFNWLLFIWVCLRELHSPWWFDDVTSCTHRWFAWGVQRAVFSVNQLQTKLKFVFYPLFYLIWHIHGKINFLCSTCFSLSKNKTTTITFMLANYGTHCRIMSVCLLEPSKLHLKLFNWIMSTVLFMTYVKFRNYRHIHVYFYLVLTKSVDSYFRAFWLAPVPRNILGYSLFWDGIQNGFSFPDSFERLNFSGKWSSWSNKYQDRDKIWLFPETLSIAT